MFPDVIENANHWDHSFYDDIRAHPKHPTCIFPHQVHQIQK